MTEPLGGAFHSRHRDAHTSSRQPSVRCLVLGIAVVLAPGAFGCASVTGRISVHQINEQPATTENERRYNEANRLYEYYGGTQLDAGLIVYCASDLATRDVFVSGPGLVLCLVDLPLSAALDTLLLPADYWLHRHDAAARQLRTLPEDARPRDLTTNHHDE